MGKRKRIRGRTSAAQKSKPKTPEAQRVVATAGPEPFEDPPLQPTTTTLTNGGVVACLSQPEAQPPRAERDERLPTQSQVQVRAVFEGTSLDEEVVNWSAGGVFVHTAQPLGTGDPVVLTFPGGDDGRALALTGRVRWVSPFGRFEDARPGMGIEFVGMTEPQRRRLASILRGHAHQPRLLPT